MKLVAAKCPNCGSKIKIEIDKKIYTCEYCRSDIILDDGTPLNQTYNTPYSLNLDELRKRQKLMMVIMAIPVITIIFFVLMVMIGIMGEFSDSNDKAEEFFDSVSVETFNFSINKAGNLSTVEVENLISDVISRMSSYDKNIVVVFNEMRLTDIPSISTVPNMINADSYKTYIVSNTKDSEGYIKEITIINGEEGTDNEEAIENFNKNIDDVGLLNFSVLFNLLNNISSILVENEDALVVSFNDKIYKEAADMQTIKDVLQSDLFKDYLVSNEKNEDGYINKIIIKEV